MPPTGGPEIMVFRRVPSAGALKWLPRSVSQVRCVAKTPPSLAHPRGTPETPPAKRFEFWARTICPLFFSPIRK